MNNTSFFRPVRKGSKDIPYKNRKKPGKKPLICPIVDIDDTLLLKQRMELKWI